MGGKRNKTNQFQLSGILSSQHPSNSGTHMNSYFSKRCDLESYSGIENGLLCTNARTKVDCKNFCDVGITDEQGEKNSSNEDDYEEI